jgi:NAD(P)H-hydrate epimerase
MPIFEKIPELPKRNQHSHKGDFGRILIVGGSLGMSGAVAMAGMGALKSGTGLVKIALPQQILPIVAAINPCYMTAPLKQDQAGRIDYQAINDIIQLAAENDVIAFGCGAGKSDSLKRIAETLIKTQNLRLLIDADGLNNLSKINNWHDLKKADIIITPHPGEMTRLWKSLFRDPMPENREKTASEFSKRTGVVTVLKGAQTVVSDANHLYVNQTGNPGMAVGGSGDVLTGIISALAGQHLDNFNAAVLGVHSHGLAGDIAAEKYGQISITPLELIAALPKAFKNQ